MKRKKYVKRVLSALLIFILSFSVLSMAVTVIFFHTAFPRSDTPSEFAYSYSQMESDGYSYQRVSFPSGSNTLIGYCFAPDDPQALVVIAAGFGDGGSSHLPEMKEFVDSGYAVLCYDATGVGESEGSGKGGLSQPAMDLRAALRNTADDDRLSKLPILLYGHSAGGYAAATCLDNDRVKAAVIISGFDHPVQLMRDSARSYVGILADDVGQHLDVGCGALEKVCAVLVGLEENLHVGEHLVDDFSLVVVAESPAVVVVLLLEGIGECRAHVAHPGSVNGEGGIDRLRAEVVDDEVVGSVVNVLGSGFGVVGHLLGVDVDHGSCQRGGVGLGDIGQCGARAGDVDHAYTIVLVTCVDNAEITVDALLGEAAKAHCRGYNSH